MSRPQENKSYWQRLLHSAPDPVRDWIVLLSLSGVCLIAIVSWNIWAFDTVARGGVIGDRVAKPAPVFNQASLHTIRTIFDKRSIEEAKYRTGSYRYADPSQ